MFYCLPLPSQSASCSPVFGHIHFQHNRSRHLSFALACLDFVFHLLILSVSYLICNIFREASALSRLWHLHSPRSMSKPYQPLPSKISAIVYMCASLQMSTFLTWSSHVFLLAHRNTHIAVMGNFLSLFLTAQHSAQHSAPYTF